MNVSFIIPCLNCEDFIQSTVIKLYKHLKNFKKINYEIIFIDDGSFDKTGIILKKFLSKKIKLITNPKNIGKSASLIKGINASRYNKILIIDCDLPYFQYLKIVLNKLQSNEFIYINRKSKKSKLLSKNLNFYQIARVNISKIICRIINSFFFDFYIGDTQAGLKAFTKPKNFNKISFLSKKFFLDAELMILFYQSKVKMLSIPVKYKIYTKSSIKIFSFENFIYIYEFVKIIFYYKIFKKKFLQF